MASLSACTAIGNTHTQPRTIYRGQPLIKKGVSKKVFPKAIPFNREDQGLTELDYFQLQEIFQLASYTANLVISTDVSFTRNQLQSLLGCHNDTNYLHHQEVNTSVKL